ncbi:MAG: hypothetical protein MUE61_08515 [Vicinamibacterales bacterium]|jgi:hypothetical protein|nr:hypothetical protein [Vicinamibacterales bacterium]MCU0477206.1 hypothetical protein [Chloroflexota bacterium]MCU0562353.1 hypothetical protein [Desulfobacterales bacterium]
MTVLDVEKLVASHQGRQGSRCQVCTWLESRSPDEQEKWDAVFADPKRWQHAAIQRAITAVEPDPSGRPGRSSIENHRAQGHRR